MVMNFNYVNFSLGIVPLFIPIITFYYQKIVVYTFVAIYINFALKPLNQ